MSRNMNLLFYVFVGMLCFGCSKDDPQQEEKPDGSTPVDQPIAQPKDDDSEEEAETPEKGEKILTIYFPENFVPAGANFHVVLSDSLGNPVDAFTYSDQEEIIDFLFKESFDEQTAYMLTFIEDYTYSTRVYMYPNLSREQLGETLVFKPRAFTLQSRTTIFKTENFEFPVMNAKGRGYHMFNYLDRNEFSGYYATQFNENLGSEHIFIKYYDPEQVGNDSYRWILFDTKTTLSGLEVNDFNSNNVQFHNFTTNRPAELPLLLIYGYENQTQFNMLAGHEIYGSYVPAFGYGGNHYYSIPDFFYETSFSLSFLNYTLFGLGTLPNEIQVPDNIVSGKFNGEKLEFSGIPEYEVGRVTLDNYPSGLKIEIIFDGTSTQIDLPKIPEGLVSNSLTANLNNPQNLRFVQTFAENYSGYGNFKDFLQQGLKSSQPFYLTSSSRERVFESNISPQLQLVPEFPFYESFR